MIRWLVILALVASVFVFIASLGSGMGYASGGGEVRIFSSWSEATSENGQAIAVYGDVDQITADNTPPPAVETPEKPAYGAALIVILFVGGGVLYFFYLKFEPYMGEEI